MHLRREINLLTTVTFLLTALLSGCGDSPDESPMVSLGTGKEFYFPGTKGNTWNYNGVDSSATRTLKYSVGQSSQTGFTLSGNENSFFGMLNSLFSSDLVFEEGSVKEVASLISSSHISRSAQYTPARLVLPARMAVGNTETSISKVTYSGNTTDTCKKEVRIEGEETIVVPAGTFNTVKVTTTYTYGDGIALPITEWYAKGVGLIRRIDGATTYTLQSYTLNPAPVL